MCAPFLPWTCRRSSPRWKKPGGRWWCTKRRAPAVWAPRLWRKSTKKRSYRCKPRSSASPVLIRCFRCRNWKSTTYRRLSVWLRLSAASWPFEVCMALEFRFPDVGEGIHEGEIVRWLVKEGDRVRPDQPMVEVETDKAVVEIPAPRAGIVSRLAAAEGQKIQVGEVLVVIDDAADPAVTAAPPQTQPVAPASASGVGSLDLALTELPPSPDVTKAAPAAASAQNRRVLAIPSVRKLARDLGVDLTQITPTGPHGRMRREDVLQAAQQRPTPAAPAAEAVPAPGLEQDPYGPIEYQPLSALRRTIAKAMVAAATTTVPVTTTDEADVTDLVALRERSRVAAAAQDVHVTLLPFIMKAVVAA